MMYLPKNGGEKMKNNSVQADIAKKKTELEAFIQNGNHIQLDFIIGRYQSDKERRASIDRGMYLRRFKEWIAEADDFVFTESGMEITCVYEIENVQLIAKITVTGKSIFKEFKIAYGELMQD